MVGVLGGGGIGEAAGEDVEGVQDGGALLGGDRVEERRHARPPRARDPGRGPLSRGREHELHRALVVRVGLPAQPAAPGERVGEAADNAAIEPQAAGQLGLREGLGGELGQRMRLRDADGLPARRTLGLVEPEPPRAALGAGAPPCVILAPVTALAIRLRGIVKRYGELTAVAGLDLEVPEGTCVGLLGPNGAGKSTTMKMLTAQVIADEGEIEVLGHVLPEDSKAARAESGVVPQLDNLDITLTVEQNLVVFSHLYRIGRRERRAAVERALDVSNLRDRRDDKVDKLSGGMRRRLLIARALVHRPRLVLLDEPTVGLDPQVRQELWALIDQLRSEGVSILMSTHYIEEAERLADTVSIMSAGRAVAAGRPHELVVAHAGRQAVEVYGPPARLAEAESQARAAGLATRRTGTSVSVLGVEAVDGRAPEGERRPTNLEDVFVLLTGEEVS